MCSGFIHRCRFVPGDTWECTAHVDRSGAFSASCRGRLLGNPAKLWTLGSCLVWKTRKSGREKEKETPRGHVKSGLPFSVHARPCWRSLTLHQIVASLPPSCFFTSSSLFLSSLLLSSLLTSLCEPSGHRSVRRRRRVLWEMEAHLPHEDEVTDRKESQRPPQQLRTPSETTEIATLFTRSNF